MARRTDYRAAANRDRATPPKAAKDRVRAEPVRVTLDLSPRQHGELKKWCAQAVIDTGLRSVPLAPVLRILADILTNGTDDDPGLKPALHAAVTAELERQAAETDGLRIPRR